MTQPAQLTRAASAVFTECLSLPQGAAVVIFADETTINLAALLAEAAYNLELQPVTLFVPLALQERIGERALYPFLTQIFEQEATALLVCLSGATELLAFRDQVRQAGLDAQCKVAHMPGIDEHTLSLVDVDYGLLLRRCELLAQALAKGREMTLVTRTRDGETHRLHVPLRPWERLPIISDALIQRGSWGNVPSGETYIAPLEGLASGSIVVNGAIPNRRLEAGDEFVLHFEQGWLQNWQAGGPVPDSHPLSPCVRHVRAKGDQYWRNLAEVGLGVNPRVHNLTGRPLLDEKKYGTFHIALGDNIDMGGQVKSVIHCDMVCVEGEVLVDDVPLVQDSQIVARPADWYEDHRTLALPPGWTAQTVITPTAMDSQEDEKGQLRRVWDTSSGKICSVPVGQPHSAQQAAIVYRTIRQNGIVLSIQELTGIFGNYTLHELLQLTCLLEKYGLVKAVSP